MEANGFDRVEACTPAQPHFDDERTVLSARPVVPLQTINARVKNRRYWLLAGALAIAMMLGAGSALLAAYLKFRSVPETANEIPQEAIITAPLAVAGSVPSESPVTEESVEDPAAIPVEPKKESTVKRRTLVKRTPELDAPRNTPKVDEEDDLNRIREAVLYDQWQERRARRVRRERRRVDRYNHRDLSNLDEIFEGRRKP
jgi:hypothetical protein